MAVEKWTEELTNEVSERLFSIGPHKKEDILRISRREKIDTTNAVLRASLTTPEQLLLAIYPAYEVEDDETAASFQHLIGNANQYNLDNLYRYANLFHCADFFYVDGTIKFLHLSSPKKAALAMFHQQKNDSKLSLFVKTLYFMPDSQLTGFHYMDAYSSSENRKKMKTKVYSLNPDVIERIDLHSLNEPDLLDFLSICYPLSFSVEPNKLLFDKKLCHNYAVRVLATLYQRLDVIIDVKTKRVVLLKATYHS